MDPGKAIREGGEVANFETQPLESDERRGPEKLRLRELDDGTVSTARPDPAVKKIFGDTAASDPCIHHFPGEGEGGVLND